MRRAMKKWMVLGLCGVSVFTMMACGNAKKNDSTDKSDKKAETQTEDKMTGTVEMTATTKEKLGETPDVEVMTTVTVDFDKNEAVLRMDANMPVGDSTMLFTIMDEAIPEDADSMQYMQCIELGKGKVTDNGDGTYTALWNAKMSEEATEATDFPVEIKVDGKKCTATISGMFDQPIVCEN